MRINIITEQPGWILHRCAVELSKALPGAAINPPPGDFDITYILPYWRLPTDFTDRSYGKLVGFFTHNLSNALRYSSKYHYRVCMNRRMQRDLRNYGDADSVVIRPGAEPPFKKPSFGVVGRTYGDGRKGEELVYKAQQAGYNIFTLGKGWPGPGGNDVADARYTKDFLEDIDYLLVTSLDEGGPMPVLEALTVGTPIIAPDVGWCWEFPCIHYEKGSWESLKEVLDQLSNPPTWQDWAEKHKKFFEKILREDLTSARKA
jgi:hypothetical protein